MHLHWVYFDTFFVFDILLVTSLDVIYIKIKKGGHTKMRKTIRRAMAWLLLCMILVTSTGVVALADTKTVTVTAKNPLEVSEKELADGIVLYLTTDMVSENGTIIVKEGTWQRLVIPKELEAKQIILKDSSITQLVVESGTDCILKVQESTIAGMVVLAPQMEVIGVKEITELLKAGKSGFEVAKLYSNYQAEKVKYEGNYPTIITDEATTFGNIQVSGNISLELCETNTENILITSVENQEKLKVTIAGYQGNLSVEQNKLQENSWNILNLDLKNSELKELYVDSKGGHTCSINQKGSSNIQSASISGDSKLYFSVPMEKITITDKAEHTYVKLYTDVKEVVVKGHENELMLTTIATVKNAIIQGDSTKIYGYGTLESAQITGDKANVSTPGTVVDGKNDTKIPSNIVTETPSRPTTAPKPTAVPEVTATPEPTAMPEVTATPEPTPSQSKHTWNVDKATCVTAKVCTECEYVEEAATGIHTFSEEGVETAATCTESGYTTFSCEYCDETQVSDIVAPLGHKVTEWQIGELVPEETCSYIQVGTCSVCEEEIVAETTVEKHSSDLLVKVTKEATCQVDGTKVYVCSDCGEEIITETYSNAEAHVWDNGENIAGKTVYHCTVDGCNATKSIVSVAEDGSVFTEDLDTATQVEVKSGVVLSFDTNVLVQIASGSALQLSADALSQIDRENAVGKLTEDQKNQLDDNEIYDFNMFVSDEQVSNFDGDITVRIPYTLADGEDPESVGIWYLADNGEVEEIQGKYHDGFVLFKTNHFSYYTVVRLTPEVRCRLFGHLWLTTITSPTCTEDGFVTKICQRCAAKEVLAGEKATGHDVEETIVEEATCQHKGKKRHECNNKHCEFYQEVETPKEKHNLKEVERKEPTCEEAGYVKYECRHGYCDYYKNEELKVTGHKKGTNGLCVYCGKNMEENSEYDFGGATVKYFGGFYNQLHTGDATWKNIKATVEEKYNIKLEPATLEDYEDYENRSDIDILLESIDNGSPVAHIVNLNTSNLAVWYESDILFDLAPYLDSTIQMGSTYTDMGKWKDKVLGISYENTGDTWVLVYDREYLKELGMDKTPTDMFMEGKWSYEDCKEYLKELQSKLPEGQYAIGTYPYHWGVMNASANGTQLVDTDGNINLANEAVIEATEFYNDLIAEGIAYPMYVHRDANGVITDSDIPYDVNDERIILKRAETWQLGTLDFEYGICYWPWGSNVTVDSDYTTLSEEYEIAIPYWGIDSVVEAAVQDTGIPGEVLALIAQDIRYLANPAYAEVWKNSWVEEQNNPNYENFGIYAGVEDEEVRGFAFSTKQDMELFDWGHSRVVADLSWSFDDAGIVQVWKPFQLIFAEGADVSSTLEYYANTDNFTDCNHTIYKKYELQEGVTSCIEGIRCIEKCTKCNYTNEWTIYNTHIMNLRDIPLSQFGSDCGGFITLYECICGESIGSTAELVCDIEGWSWDDIRNYDSFIGETEGDFAYHEESFSCAVTEPECNLHFDVKYEATRVQGCTWKVKTTLCYDEDGDGNYEQEYVICASQYTGWHPLAEEPNDVTYSTTEDGTIKTKIEKFICGRCQDYEEIKTYADYLNNESYAYLIEQKWGNINELKETDKWEYDFSNEDYCSVTKWYISANDEYYQFVTEPGCYCPNEEETRHDNGCTQYAYGTCAMCGNDNPLYDRRPGGHDFNYSFNEETGMWQCHCGLESESGINGKIALEDMSNNDNYIAGYYQFGEWSWEILDYEVFVFLRTEEEDIQTDLTVENSNDIFTSGTVSLSKEEVEKWAENNGVTEEYEVMLTFALSDQGENLSYNIILTDRNICEGEHDIYLETVLLEEGTSCEDGVVCTEKCRNCDYENEWTDYWHAQMTTEIPFSQFGSTCDGFFRLYECACGYEAWSEAEFNCNTEYSWNHILYQDNFIREAESDFAEYKEVITCANSDCNLHFDVKYEARKVGSCTWRVAIYLCYDADGDGTYEQEYVIEKHNYYEHGTLVEDSTSYETAEDGTKVKIVTSICEQCHNFEEVNTYADYLGDGSYLYQIRLESGLLDSEGRDGMEWIYEFGEDSCSVTPCYFGMHAGEYNWYEEGETEPGCHNVDGNITGPTCTDYAHGICAKCGNDNALYGDEYRPFEHDFSHFNEETGMWECWHCGEVWEE